MGGVPLNHTVSAFLKESENNRVKIKHSHQDFSSELLHLHKVVQIISLAFRIFTISV